MSDWKTAEEWAQMVQPLLNWYDQHSRILPWRENKEPYPVWVSEIMLQQTRVETVKPYFDEFMKELPTVKKLAEAEEGQLLKLWEGLGYYNRVRNLQKAAKLIMEQYKGQFPTSYEKILSLPGIGTYTAGAISSICFEKPTPAVDGNVLRVLSRVTESYADIASAKIKKKMTEKLEEIYPVLRRGDFTQSFMELGAMICTPAGVPKCEECPLQFLCKAFAKGTQRKLPVKAKKKPRRKEERTVFILSFGNKLAVHQREKGGLLGGMWELPNVEGQLTPKGALQALEPWNVDAQGLEKSINRKHVFTHIEWHMIGYFIPCQKESPLFSWVTPEELEREISLPSAFRIFLE